MGQPAARISDMHTCPMVSPGPVPHVGGPIVKGAPNVLTCGMPQSRVSDLATCVGPPDVIVKGSATVLVGSLPAARLGDNTAHGGVIVSGAPTVLIGDGGGSGGGGGGGTTVATGTGSDGISSPGSQAKAMIAASEAGTPFCAVCKG